MEIFSPKVTIELSEYNNLKDLEFQVKHCLERNGFDLIEKHTNDPLKLETVTHKELQILDTELLYFFNNLFGVNKVKIYDKEDELKLIIEKVGK